MSNRRQTGLSLVELVVFIVVMGIGLVAMLLLFGQYTRSSVDPLLRKQALAIASTLLEEVQLQPFTFCDPGDPNVHTATASPGGGCATDEAIGAEGAESRYGPLFFDNVSDYDGFSMAAGAIRTIDDPTPIAPLADYSVSVAVASIAANELGPLVATTSDALRITVTATHVPTNTAVTLQGYRLRYAPNAP